MYSKRFFLFLASIGMLCLSFQSSVEEEMALSRTWYDRIEEVKDIMEGFFNDDALGILRQLESEIAEEGMQMTRIGILTQLYIGDALEKDQKDQEAIKKLLWVRELSLDKGYIDIYAETCIILALLYEKLGMQSDCRVNLHQAEQAILDNQLDTIFPEFAIRKSSYYRVFGFPDSAITYAQQALETAVELQQQEQTSVAHLLLGMLKRSTPEEALLHFQECIRIFTGLQDYTGCIYAYVNSLKCYQRLGRYEEALLYSDSSVMAIPTAVKNGNDAFTWGRVYKARAEVFYALGQIDSAWYNINKASSLDLEFERRNNAQQVAEIDAKYNDEKKAQRLAEQDQVIKFERQRRIFLTVLTLLFLGFSAILTFYYLRLRAANRKTVQQAATITKKNEDLSRSLEEQIILQSEVHHRVKNNLQVIISLLEIQKEDLQDPNAMQNLDAMANRIYSMAAIHEILYQHNGVARIDFIEYAQRLCRHLANLSPDGSYPQFDLQIEPVFFNLETSIPLGIMLTELLTNSLKYARLPEKDLHISIQLQAFEDHYRIIYRDNGPGLPEGGIRQREGGLGTYLLRSMTRQLRGQLISRTEEGALFEIHFYEKNKLTNIEINPEEIKQGASTEK